MSARAAWRLETLGFSRVYRYTPGKMDWLANDLPREGDLATVPLAGDVARRGVPTCRRREGLGGVRERTQAAGWDVCIVVEDGDVVLGRLRGDAWNADPDRAVEEVMENGPTTVRPSVPLDALVQRMQQRRVGSILITSGDGVLLGILYRRDAEKRLEQAQQAPGPRH